MEKSKINAQIERFRKGFPYLDIVAPATPGKGIEVLDGEKAREAAEYADTAEVRGKCKFVPASGAASRMFKDIFAGLDTPNDSVRRLAENLEKYNPTIPSRPDLVEVMPGIMPRILKEIRGYTDIPLIAGGLISDKKDVMAALSAGADGISTTNEGLWLA